MRIEDRWFKWLTCVVLVLGGYTGYCGITGSLGGSTRFTETTGLAYSIELDNEEAHLSVAVLMRGKTRGWLSRHSDQPPSHFGNGGSIGRHYVVHDRGAGVVWVDDMAYVVAADANLLLFDSGGVEANAPRLLYQLSLETYLGDVSGVPAGGQSRRFQEALIKRLEASVAVQAFVSRPLL